MESNGFKVQIRMCVCVQYSISSVQNTTFVLQYIRINMVYYMNCINMSTQYTRDMLTSLYFSTVNNADIYQEISCKYHPRKLHLLHITYSVVYPGATCIQPDCKPSDICEKWFRKPDGLHSRCVTPTVGMVRN